MQSPGNLPRICLADVGNDFLEDVDSEVVEENSPRVSATWLMFHPETYDESEDGQMDVTKAVEVEFTGLHVDQIHVKTGSSC